jgi:hypothetical protein
MSEPDSGGALAAWVCTSCAWVGTDCKNNDARPKADGRRAISQTAGNPLDRGCPRLVRLAADENALTKRVADLSAATSKEIP